MRLRNQLVIASEKFARVEDVYPLLITIMLKYTDEELKLAHKVVDVFNRPQETNCVILLRYILDKLDSSFDQIQFFAKKEEDEKNQESV